MTSLEARMQEEAHLNPIFLSRLVAQDVELRAKLEANSTQMVQKAEAVFAEFAELQEEEGDVEEGSSDDDEDGGEDDGEGD